jgi:hypothetical protein
MDSQSDEDEQQYPQNMGEPGDGAGGQPSQYGAPQGLPVQQGYPPQQRYPYGQGQQQGYPPQQGQQAPGGYPQQLRHGAASGHAPTGSQQQQAGAPAAGAAGGSGLLGKAQQLAQDPRNQKKLEKVGAQFLKNNLMGGGSNYN